MTRCPETNGDEEELEDGSSYHISSPGAKTGKTELARIQVGQKSVTLEELKGTIEGAALQYTRALTKYRQGEDYFEDWLKCLESLEIQRDQLTQFIAVTRHNMGVILTKQKEYKAAVEHFKAALKANPAYAGAAYNLAVVFDKLGQPDRSREMLAKAKALGYKPRKKAP